jgi:hypothetical protein
MALHFQGLTHAPLYYARASRTGCGLGRIGRSSSEQPRRAALLRELPPMSGCNTPKNVPAFVHRYPAASFRSIQMSSDRKNANANEHGSAEKKDADRPGHDKQETGQSQDASRHQQDAAHHKGFKGPEKGAK